MYFGWIAAAITGLGLPAFVFLIGDLINSFDPNNKDPKDMLKMVKLLSMIFSIIGGGIFLFSYVFYSFLLMSSEMNVKKIRMKYLESILS